METESEGRKRKEEETGSGREKWSRQREIETPLLLLLLAWADKRYIKAERLLKKHFNVRSEGMEIRAPCSHTSIQRCTAHCCFVFFFPKIPNQILWLPAGFLCQTQMVQLSAWQTHNQSEHREKGEKREKGEANPPDHTGPFNNLVKRTSNRM